MVDEETVASRALLSSSVVFGFSVNVNLLVREYVNILNRVRRYSVYQLYELRTVQHYKSLPMQHVHLQRLTGVLSRSLRIQSCVLSTLYYYYSFFLIVSANLQA